MRVLVTGGAGFVGSHVVDALVASGHEPVVLDRVPPRRPDLPWVRGDVRDPDAVAAALRGVDGCCHQAAKVGLGVGVGDLPAYAGDNGLGTATLLAGMAAAGCRRLVLASSMVVYGEGRYACHQCPPGGDGAGVAPAPRRVEDLRAGRFEPPCPRCGGPLRPIPVPEEARLDPRSGYAASKVAQEHYAAAWAREVGGSVVALRYHNVYGPRLPEGTPYAGVAALFRSALHRGEAPRVFEDGGQRRDFVHVRDVAQANLAALSCGDTVPVGRLRAYNVGSGVPRTVGDLAAALARVTSGPPPVVTGEYRLGDVRHLTASSRRIREELGWRPAEPFEHGVAELAGAGAAT